MPQKSVALSDLCLGSGLGPRLDGFVRLLARARASIPCLVARIEPGRQCKAYTIVFTDHCHGRLQWSEAAPCACHLEGHVPVPYVGS